MKSDILIGKIKTAHGLKGELYVLVFSRDSSWSKDLKSLTLRNADGGMQSYGVIRSKPHKEGLIVTLDGVTDRNHSESLMGLEVYISSHLLESKKGETIYLKEILGFEVLVGDQIVGVVDSFSSNGTQDLMVIQKGGHSFEVPFVEQFIIKIEFSKSQILMNFPLELIDLNRKASD